MTSVEVSASAVNSSPLPSPPQLPKQHTVLHRLVNSIRTYDLSRKVTVFPREKKKIGPQKKILLEGVFLVEFENILATRRLHQIAVRIAQLNCQAAPGHVSEFSPAAIFQPELTLNCEYQSSLVTVFIFCFAMHVHLDFLCD